MAWVPLLGCCFLFFVLDLMISFNLSFIGSAWCQRSLGHVQSGSWIRKWFTWSLCYFHGFKCIDHIPHGLHRVYYISQWWMVQLNLLKGYLILSFELLSCFHYLLSTSNILIYLHLAGQRCPSCRAFTEGCTPCCCWGAWQTLSRWNVRLISFCCRCNNRTFFLTYAKTCVHVYGYLWPRLIQSG